MQRGLTWRKSPAVVTLFGGGRRVGSLDEVAATKYRDSGEIIEQLPIFSRDLYYDREGFLIVEAGGSIGVEEAAFGNKRGLGVENGGLEEVTQDSIFFGVSFERETVNGELWIVWASGKGSKRLSPTGKD